MILKSPFLVLVASWIGTLSLFSTGGRAQSVCANWWNSLAPSQKPTSITVKLRKRTDGAPGRIDGSRAGRQACGITYTDDDHGACLWGGRNAVEPPPDGQQPGWVSGYINRGGQQAKGKVVDSCSFDDGENMTVEQGCSSIYVTRATFIALGGDPNGTGRIQVDNWDL
ncbi:uncharacterized protein VP01_1688g2 [Puccinia sorghi]|uniref:Uncharacterized protein n=1 Tax=Puccinia sorghi TaxID=27349 RepID=A0A0L6VGF3_9BASI|nr:uncharacterized protein VP01_1688g2 [Puccinia sorghi]